ncbi:MAG: biotin--[acetyl-CoA-carboxylase] ligase [Bacteroidetes bacterium]|nr:MAG: biotin--[acetyl-CoA-carboxylase] ligase [Bacteroidota bacterium]
MPQFTGHHLIHLSEAPSTNSLASQLLPDQPAEGTVIRADAQTAGRGQRGNSWWVEPGQNLTFSLIYYPTFLPVAQIHLISKLTALAVREAVAYWRPEAEVLIKWPNDLLLNRQKVAGILIENQIGQRSLRSTIIGIGLNVNQQHWPPELAGRATSLAAIGAALSLDEVFADLLTRLETYYLMARRGQAAAIDQAYLQHLYGYAQRVKVQRAGQLYRERLIGVDAFGRLLLEGEAGQQAFDVKEVQILPEPLNPR